METPKRDSELASLLARQRKLRHALVRVQRQIIQAEHRILAAEKRITSLTGNPRLAA